MPLVSLSEASRATGVSRQQIYRLRDRGVLDGWVHRDAKGKPLIELAGLREHLCTWSRMRVDSFHLKPEPGMEEEVSETEMIAEWANVHLQPEAWGPPPWPATRWLTLVDVWADAQWLLETYGRFSHRKWALLEEEAEMDLKAMEEEEEL